MLMNVRRGGWKRRAGTALLAAGVCAAAAGPARGQGTPRRELAVDGEFGYLASVAVDRAGRMYAADVMTQQLYIFDPSGAPAGTLGRRGYGPGEFQGVVSAVAGRGDTLYTFDAVLQRITAFAPGTPRRVAYTIQIPPLEGERASYQLLVPSAGPFLVPFARSRGRDHAASPQVTLRTVSRDGRVGTRAVSQGPDREALELSQGDQHTVGPMPYGRAPAFAVHGGRVYHAWSGSGEIPVRDAQGHRLGAIRTGTATLPVESRHLRTLLDSYPPEDPRGQAMRQASQDRLLPATKPAWKQMLVDDRGQVWVNVVTSDDVVRFHPDRALEFTSFARLRREGPGQTPWWVYAPRGNRVAIHMLPGNVSLTQVSGGRAYGIETDADGVQRVVRFAVGN